LFFINPNPLLHKFVGQVEPVYLLRYPKHHPQFLKLQTAVFKRDIDSLAFTVKTNYILFEKECFLKFYWVNCIKQNQYDVPRR